MSTTHWTQQNVDAFVHRISSDFASQLQTWMNAKHITHSEFADSMCITPGRVSQILNDPGNLTIRNMVRCSRSLGKKVAVIAYDDGDAENRNGPVNSEIFVKCWEISGRPTDFFQLAALELCNKDSVTIVASESCTVSGASKSDTGSCVWWANDRNNFSASTMSNSGATATAGSDIPISSVTHNSSIVEARP